MSGHSHWAGIKHKKAATDAKKANIFTKLGKMITIAAKEGADPASNFKLRLAIDKAREFNMPKENIEKAAKRGSGELKGEEIKEIIYEAYGPGNIALLIKTATDNTNRTLGELKSILTKAGGKLVSAGSVSFLFKKVGAITINAEEKNLDELELAAIDSGAQDSLCADGMLTIFVKPDELKKVKENLELMNVKIDGAEIVFAPLQKIKIDQDTKLDYEKLLEALDENDDVQIIYDNL